MLFSMPAAFMAPPKHMAQMMSQMVFSMPLMPRVATSSVSSSLLVLNEVLPKKDIIMPLNKPPSLAISFS